MGLYLVHCIGDEEVPFEEVKRRLVRTTPTIEGILARLRERVALEEASDLQPEPEDLCAGA